MPMCAQCRCGGADTAASTVCKRCGKRAYCSEACRETDWGAGHSLWCGKAGELDVDFEVRDMPGKGKGLVALRPFSAFEAIMVERPLLLTPGTETLGPAATAALLALCPEGGTLAEKCTVNRMSCAKPAQGGGACAAERRNGVFATMARCNHSCLPNAEHHYDADTGIKRLTATTSIAAGEEICIFYVDPQRVPSSARRQKLRACYGFDCTCRACRDPAVATELDRLPVLDAAVAKLAGSERTRDAAIAKGLELLRLLDFFACSVAGYARAYYDLFQVAVMKAADAPRAVEYAAKAAEWAERAYGSADQQVAKYQEFAAQPQRHRNYGAMDGEE